MAEIVTKTEEIKLCSVEDMNEEQESLFDERAENDQVVALTLTLNEATTLLECLKDGKSIAMMRAAQGYPKSILSTIVNCADELYNRVGLTSQKAFVKLHNEVLVTSPTKES